MRTPNGGGGGFKSPTPDRTGSKRAGSEKEGGQAGRPESGRYAPLSEQSTLYSRLNLPVSLVAAHMSLVRSNGIRVNKALCPGRSRPRGWLPTAWVPERRTGPRERLGLGCLFHVLNEFSFVQ